jgi:hypothetical protein
MDHDSWVDHLLQLVGATPGDHFSHFFDQLAHSGADVSGLTADDITKLFAHFQHHHAGSGVRFTGDSTDLGTTLDGTQIVKTDNLGNGYTSTRNWVHGTNPKIKDEAQGTWFDSPGTPQTPET